MKKYTEHCDLCEIEFVNEIDKNGFCVELGYSHMGWGSRKDFTPKRTVEICTDCFNEVKKKAIEINEVINKLKK